MPELFGEENINWDTFEVVDPDATPSAPDAEAPSAPGLAGHGGDDDSLAPEDTVQDEGRPRDPETGRFLSDEEAAGREQADAEQARVQAYLQKFGGDAEQALRAAAHLDEVVGRQGQELGEARRAALEAEQLRQQMAELSQRLERPAAPTFAPDYESLFAENPVAAVEAAFRAEDRYAVERLLREWEQIDPAQVDMYRMTKTSQVTAQQERAQREQLEQRLAQQTYGSIMEQQWTRLQTDLPGVDLDALSQAMSEEARATAHLSGHRYSEDIKSGDPERVYHAFRTLALAAMHRDAGAQHQRLVDLSRTQAIESQRAKAEAVVTSASATAPEPPAAKSYDDEFLEQIQAEDKRRDGWTIGKY